MRHTRSSTSRGISAILARPSLALPQWTVVCTGGSSSLALCAARKLSSGISDPHRGVLCAYGKITVCARIRSMRMSIRTTPPTVGFGPRPVRPIAILLINRASFRIYLQQVRLDTCNYFCVTYARSVRL